MRDLKEKDVIEKLKLVKDPELSIDIWTLGLIYKITIDDEGVEVLMTLTSPFCPFANDLILGVEKAVEELGSSRAGHVRVEITFEPAWEPSKELRSSLGI
ncbi:MAG TPA: metal-sulfur cluster assembly factor [Candidatus Yonathbacteria bacterium]|nr:metal-sulfur cluster assembly factor [Candidatus Yonathbacteria bacterium]